MLHVTLYCLIWTTQWINQTYIFRVHSMFCTHQVQEEKMLTKQESTLQATLSKRCLLNCEHTKKEPMTLCAHAVLHTGLWSCPDPSNAFWQHDDLHGKHVPGLLILPAALKRREGFCCSRQLPVSLLKSEKFVPRFVETRRSAALGLWQE